MGEHAFPGDEASIASHGETTKSVLMHWQPVLDDELKAESSPIRLLEKATTGVDIKAVAIGTCLSFLVVVVVRPDFVLTEALTRFDAPSLDPVKLLIFTLIVAVALVYLTRR